MENHNGFLRSRQTLVAQLLAWSKKETFRRPEPTERYFCPFKNDHTHWAGTVGQQMIFVVTATRKWAFNFLALRLGFVRSVLMKRREA